MSKVLVMDYPKCVGCLSCMQACSAKHEALVNPILSRIDIVKLMMRIECVPIACQQCETAACNAICPVNAISRDDVLGRVTVNYYRCIGCRMCVTACPFGCMSFDSMNKRVFKCELCDGDPMCVRFCQHDALQYVEASEQGGIKRTALAEKISGIVHKITSAMGTA